MPGEVIFVRTGPNTVLIQIPLKTVDQVRKDLECGERYLCAVDSRGIVTVIKRK